MTYLKECDIMSDRPIGLGKVAENGTLNENGAFYSVQDINVLLEEKGGGGGDLPTPTVADAGKAVVVDEEGKYALGETGGGGLVITRSAVDDNNVLDKTYKQIYDAILSGITPIILVSAEEMAGLNGYIIDYISGMYISNDGGGDIYEVSTTTNYSYISSSENGVLVEDK